MKRFIILTSLILYSTVFAQIVDSTKTKMNPSNDTVAVKKDTLIATDTLLTKVRHDSLKAINSLPLTSKSYLIERKDLLMTEYKYTGDYLRLFPFNFIKDLGFTGQPNETFLYGLGNQSISFLLDGVSINERFYDALNLNLIQSEDIDSIEVLPLPRGFLYGAYNNPVTVNFITRDFITSQPYSRLRYYQGPDRETMLDGTFNLRVTNRLITTFEITNRIVDSTFDNSEFSIWQGKIKLKYLLSNDINIIATYNYNDYKAGYSGGVDVDSIKRTGADVNNVLYDNVQAPVIYPNGKVSSLTHMPRLRFLIKPTNWLNTDASIFYLYSKNVKNTFENETVNNKVYGINIRNDATYKNFKFQLNIDYEKDNIIRDHTYNYVGSNSLIFPTTNINIELLSVSGIISINDEEGKLVPSIFYKSSQISGNLDYLSRGLTKDYCSGFGGDVIFKLTENLSFYFGCSIFNNYANSNNYFFLEIGTKYNSKYFNAAMRYFANDYQHNYLSGGPFHNLFGFGKVDGLGANIELNLWKLSLESTSAYYHPLNNKLIGVPNFQTQTGLYYKNILFENNLDLKTGFVATYTGRNNVFTAEQGLVEVSSSYKLDYTLAGEIQKRAIVYFVWQNLLDNHYYITPYYPMPGRSIRFGVAWELFN